MNNSLQQLIQRHHVHPNNPFIKFDKKDVELSVPERFQKQVDMHPEQIAIKTREHVFTYNALNQFANRIARAILIKRVQLRCAEGEHQAEPIAILFESGAPIIAAILGVLKVGKFYVPLDTSLPPARISYILKDSQAGLLLTDSKNISFAKKLQISGLEILNIDEIDSSISGENLDLPLQPDNFAYIIYTSGSTGQPKGVIQNHRYILHLTMNYTNSGHICADDRLALLYSPNFAGAVRDIFCSLLNGATLLPYNVKQEGLIGLSSWLNQQEITIFFAVATMFRHFVNTLTQQNKFPKLRLIQVGSETVYKKDVELYKQHFSDDCIFVANLGGSEISPIRQYFVDRETEILAFLNQSTIESQSIIKPVDGTIKNDVPLSFTQQQFWLLHHLEESNYIYNIVRAFRLEGDLDIPSFKQAIQCLIARHSILRTGFKMVDGSPVQVVTPHLTFDIPVIDLQNLSETERISQAQQLLLQERTRAFDLNQPPVWRVTLIRLHLHIHLLMFNLHHIICDDWSIQIFLRELSALYQEILIGKTASLPELPIQYTDFAHWQNQQIALDKYHQQLNYWQQQLADVVPVLELPYLSDRSNHNTKQAFQSGIVPLSVSAEVSS